MLKTLIESAWNDRSLLNKENVKNAVLEVVENLDKGTIRVADYSDNGWHVN